MDSGVRENGRAMASRRAAINSDHHSMTLKLRFVFTDLNSV